MMNVPVDDGNPLDVMTQLSVPCADCNIVEETKSHHGISLCVMPRWTNSTEHVREQIIHNGVDARHNAACRKKRYLVRFLAGVGIPLVQNSHSALAGLTDKLYVLWRVNF